MWTLTSTDRTLRDTTTAALHWYGMNDPQGLFALSVEAAGINDPYILERMLAASAGVAMTRQVHDPQFEPVLAEFLVHLADAFFAPDAAAPTGHALTRHYTSRLFELAAAYYPNALPDSVTLPLVFAPGAAVDMLDDQDARRAEVEYAVRMVFGNYTIGRLFPGRRNYDDEARRGRRARRCARPVAGDARVPRGARRRLRSSHVRLVQHLPRRPAGPAAARPAPGVGRPPWS